MCKELNEMGIMDIQPNELMEWMCLGCGKDDGDGVKYESGVEDDMYGNGTWMIDGWVVVRNKNNNSSAKQVGSGKNKDRAECTNKLGCACARIIIEMGPPKEMSDLLQGSYSCSTGLSMKRKRSSMPRGSFRTTTPSWSMGWRTCTRRTTPIMGRRRRQPSCLETSTELSELSVNLLQPSGGRAQDLREGQVEGDGEVGRVQPAVEGRDGQVCDENIEKIIFKISSPHHCCYSTLCYNVFFYFNLYLIQNISSFL